MEVLKLVGCFMVFILFLVNSYTIFWYIHQPIRAPRLTDPFGLDIDILNYNESIIYLGLPRNPHARIGTLNVNHEESRHTTAGRGRVPQGGRNNESKAIFTTRKQNADREEISAKSHTSHPRNAPLPSQQWKSPMRFDSNVVEDPPDFHLNNQRKPTECLIRYPINTRLQFNNLHWQVLEIESWKIYLYSAFYDNRAMTVKNPDVRILGITNSLLIRNQSFYCQLWFSEYQEAKVVQVKMKRFLWPWNKSLSEGRHNLPFMLSCSLNGALKNLTPFAVSVVTNKCDFARNKLNVINPHGPRKPPSDFGVCVKGLDFPETDNSPQLVEWIELLLLLGANRIHVYLYAVHPNVQKVLDHYERAGTVEVGPLTIPGALSNEPLIRHRFFTHVMAQKRYLEMLPYNDCLYRNMRYRYLAFLDVDEVIVPLKVKTWKELFQDIRNSGERNETQEQRVSSYQVKQNGCFFHGVERPWFDGIPKTMHMLQHVYKMPSKENASFETGMKGFFVPKNTLLAFNHQPFLCFQGPCRKMKLNETLVQLQHYKHIHRHCNGPARKQTENHSCQSLACLNNSITDKTLWKYKTTLVERFQKSIEHIFKDQPPTQWTE